MQGFETFGKLLVVIGVVIAVVGGGLWLAGRFFGARNMPGTIRIETSGFTCLIPILGSIILSLVLTVVLNLVIRLINR